MASGVGGLVISYFNQLRERTGSLSWYEKRPDGEHGADFIGSIGPNGSLQIGLDRSLRDHYISSGRRTIDVTIDLPTWREALRIFSNLKEHHHPKPTVAMEGYFGDAQLDQYGLEQIEPIVASMFSPDSQMSDDVVAWKGPIGRVREAIDTEGLEVNPLFVLGIHYPDTLTLATSKPDHRTVYRITHGFKGNVGQIERYAGILDGAIAQQRES